jgi:hypothetical protein
MKFELNSNGLFVDDVHLIPTKKQDEKWQGFSPMILNK